MDVGQNGEKCLILRPMVEGCGGGGRLTDRCCPCGLSDLDGLLEEGTDAFEQQDRSKDEYADGGDAVVEAA